jgi:hypothetical protein
MKAIDRNGFKRYLPWKGRPDIPSVVRDDGLAQWVIGAGWTTHRHDGPAVVAPDGYQEWRVEGKLEKWRERLGRGRIW